MINTRLHIKIQKVSIEQTIITLLLPNIITYCYRRYLFQVDTLVIIASRKISNQFDIILTDINHRILENTFCEKTRYPSHQRELHVRRKNVARKSWRKR